MVLALQWCFGPSYFPQDKFFLPSFFRHEWTFICEHVVRTFNNWDSLCLTLITGTYTQSKNWSHSMYAALFHSIVSLFLTNVCIAKQISHNINTH